jgi:hypothetical protein
LNAISSKNNPIIAQAAQNRKDWELLWSVASKAKTPMRLSDCR